MASRTRPIVPTRLNSQTIRDVFASGSDPNATNPNSGASWLAPPDAPAVAGGRPGPHVVPPRLPPPARRPPPRARAAGGGPRVLGPPAPLVRAPPRAWGHGWWRNQ